MPKPRSSWMHVVFCAPGSGGGRVPGRVAGSGERHVTTAAAGCPSARGGHPRRRLRRRARTHKDGARVLVDDHCERAVGAPVAREVVQRLQRVAGARHEKHVRAVVEVGEIVPDRLAAPDGAHERLKPGAGVRWGRGAKGARGCGAGVDDRQRECCVALAAAAAARIQPAVLLRRRPAVIAAPWELPACHGARLPCDAPPAQRARRCAARPLPIGREAQLADVQ